MQVWMLAAGYTLAFGSMFSKTWRVHVIFTNKKVTKKIVKDVHLMLMVLGCFSLDCLVLVLWQAIDPLHWTQVKLHIEEVPGKATINQYVVDVCSCKYGMYWTGALYSFKALLLVFGIFFAWETRKVQIEALNDSKQIGLCVYNVMIMSLIGVPLVHLLGPGQLDISYGVVATCILVCATTALALVFGTKMYQIVHHGAQVDAMTAMPFANTLRDRAMTANEVPPDGASMQHTLQTINTPSFSQLKSKPDGEEGTPGD